MAGIDNDIPGLTDLVTIQQSAVEYLGLLIQTISEKFPNWQDVPATATSTGTPGQVAYDATHFYVCVATDTWVRATLSTF